MDNKILIAFFLTMSVCNAERHLQGEISSQSIDSTGNPYIIEKTIIIPQGKQIVIKEGCVFLFKNYSGIKVLGNLFVKGTPGKNVIFTSINDSLFNKKSEQAAKPFDWNGIIVDKGADTVKMDNFRLFYSSYGIKSLNDKIALKCAIFGRNGQYNFVISDKMQDVKDNEPFSFNVLIDKSVDSTRAVKPVGYDKGSETIYTTRNIIRYSSLVVGVVGAVIGVVYAVKASNTNETLNDKGYFYAQAQIQQKPVDVLWDDMHKKWESETMSRNISIGVGAVGLTGFSLTFLF
jgi:uncharacterized membrane protein YiaA